MEEHNIARLLRRGIAVSLHTGDPPYFVGYLSHCFEQTAAALDLSAAEVVEMNKNAIRAASWTARRNKDFWRLRTPFWRRGFKQITVLGS